MVGEEEEGGGGERRKRGQLSLLHVTGELIPRRTLMTANNLKYEFV